MPHLYRLRPARAALAFALVLLGLLLAADPFASTATA
jgi:hypothetical protein